MYEGWGREGGNSASPKLCGKEGEENECRNGHRERKREREREELGCPVSWYRASGESAPADLRHWIIATALGGETRNLLSEVMTVQEYSPLKSPKLWKYRHDGDSSDDFPLRAYSTYILHYQYTIIKFSVWDISVGTNVCYTLNKS